MWKTPISVSTSDRGLAEPCKEGRRGRHPMCEVKMCGFWSGVSKGAVPLLTNIIHVGIDQFDGLDRGK